MNGKVNDPVYKDVKGFTLVELVTVITILGILAGIMVPMLLGNIDDAHTKAEFTAGESCRLAAQAKLDAMEYMGTRPDYNRKGEFASKNGIDFWHSSFSAPVIKMSGQEVRNLFIATGQYDTYLGSDSLTPAYTVYGVIYQRSEDSIPVFYDGEEWVKEFPWKNFSPDNPVVQIGGKAVTLQLFCLMCESDDPVSVFTGLQSGAE